MTAVKFFRFLMLSLSVSGLIACGGGGGDDVAGIGGTGITASGSITGFGSIFVNGIKFDIDSANITVADNTSATQADLDIGMRVTVRGTLDEGGLSATASSVVYKGEVEGPVQNTVLGPDGLTKQFDVLGIKVIADSTSTIFQGTSFDTLGNENVVEISGYFDQNETLIASRIEYKDTFTNLKEVEIRGEVVTVNSTTFDLKIDKDTILQFDTEGTADLSDITGGVITVGMFVEVEGEMDALNDPLIKATRVSEESALFDEDEDRVSLEGIITSLNSNESFFVAGQEVNAAGYVFNGLVLSEGMEVEVEGPRTGGIIFAQEIEVETAEIKMAARVAEVDSVNKTITLSYFGGDVLVYIDAKTSFDDEFGSMEPYMFDDVTTSDFLVMEAHQDSDGNVVAKEVKRVALASSPDDDLLQGPVDECITDGDLTILGVPFLMLDGTTAYEDQNENTIDTSSNFCIALANNPTFYAKVVDKATADGTADEAELED